MSSRSSWTPIRMRRSISRRACRRFNINRTLTMRRCAASSSPIKTASCTGRISPKIPPMPASGRKIPPMKVQFAAEADAFWRSDWIYLATSDTQHIDAIDADSRGPGIAQNGHRQDLLFQRQTGLRALRPGEAASATNLICAATGESRRPTSSPTAPMRPRGCRRPSYCPAPRRALQNPMPRARA